jgi:Fe-S-cluster-containing hydrogenase component 2
LVPAAQWSAADDLSLHAPPSTLHAPPPRPDPTAWLEHFNAAYWQATAERCLSCRLCAYVCPTCRCFIIRDEPQDQPGQYLRLRCWDACPGENYRRLAGGHRPRTQKGERLRNRFFCKFYYYSEQYGLDAAVACTGCGRCIDVCPVNIDITEVLSDLAHLADDEERTAQRAKSWRLSQESESE